MAEVIGEITASKGGDGAEEGAGLPRLNMLSQIPTPEILQLVPEALARRYRLIPLEVKDNSLRVAMANPGDILAIEALAARTRKRIEPVAASEVDIRDAIDFNYRAFGDTAKRFDAAGLKAATAGRVSVEADTDTAAVQALDLIFEEAVKSRASDIHIEPEKEQLRIRYRIDGTLHDVLFLPLDIHAALNSRVKILAGMNIADYRRPQDGQISLQVKNRDIDIRVATAYTVNGEMMVLRLLDKSLASFSLSQLGFLPETQRKYEQMLAAPYGMILLSGPTGAGKTTTLYASVNSLDRVSRHIITLEDPVEYHFENINQIQVNPRAGITFADGLRAILRLDPDVVLVGEIRDGNTASMATQAALTGHLMLSSVHANDTIGVLFRLIDLGVEAFLICSAVVGVVAQRMVRRVCPHCARLAQVPVAEQIAYSREIGEERSEFLCGDGCRACAYTGYLGRTALFEVMSLSDELKQMLVDGATPAQLRKRALSEGMISLAKDGMLKVKAGITTPSEVLRNAYVME